MLTAAVASAARTVSVAFPVVNGRMWDLAWGEQVDVRPIENFGPDEGLSEAAVAAYIAKYATKAAEDTGTPDRRIHDIEQMDMSQVRPHIGRLVYTCWRLGNARLYPQLEDLKLRTWAHMLGFRGHFSTKSRRYSTTLGKLRQVRTDFAADRPGWRGVHTDAYQLALPRAGPHSRGTRTGVDGDRYGPRPGRGTR